MRSFGEWQPDVNGIAVGFRPGNGLPPMAINCGAPAFKVSSEYLLNEVRPKLIEIVRKIEEGLGQARGLDPADSRSSARSGTARARRVRAHFICYTLRPAECGVCGCDVTYIG